MSDIVDIANDRAEQTLQDSLANRVRFTGISNTHCDECDAQIPQQRRDALPGVKLCVDCQSIEERR